MILEQGSQQWLAIRRKHITATDSSVILGMNPWKSPYILWREKLGLDEPPPPNEAMIRGSEMEASARNYLCGYLQRDFIPLVVFSNQSPFMMASLDGITLEKDLIVEIKCPGKRDHDLAKKGHIPLKYFPQIQHQLYVCELEEALYFSFDGVKGVLVEVKRHDRFIDEMLLWEEKFYESMMNLEPPEKVDSDYVWEEMQRFKVG